MVEHLDGYVDKLPDQDGKSRAIVEQMKADESRHGSNAKAAGRRTYGACAASYEARVARDDEGGDWI